MSTALVTGATSGIGHAFVHRLAREGYHLVVVSRDAQRLEKVAVDVRTTYGVDVEVLAADLADDDGCRAVEARLADRARPVDVLVNNAGFVLGRRFLRADVEEEERLLRVLVHAVMRLTRAALPGMLDRRYGLVVNVSSVAGFLPQSTYSAAKAWVTSFTLGIAGDLSGTGVRAQALCPGFTRTEFHDRSGIDMRRLPEWMWLDADEVVDASFRALSRGQAICVPGRQYKAMVTVARHLPLRLLSTALGRLRRHRRTARGSGEPTAA